MKFAQDIKSQLLKCIFLMIYYCFNNTTYIIKLANYKKKTLED